MWTDTAILRFTLLSGLIGFITFCACYSYLVWRKRNTHTRAETDSRHLHKRLVNWSTGLLLVGLLAMGFASVMREVVSVEGVLRGEGLYAVRARDQARPVRVAELGEVAADAPLAEFASTQSQNERESLEIKRSRLQAERELLAIQPLPLDQELIRRHQNAVVNERESRSTLDQLLGAASTAERDLFDQIFKKEQGVIQLRGDLNVAQKKLEHAEKKLVLAGKQLDREQSMQRRGFGSASEVEERSKEVQTISADVAEQRHRAAASDADLRQTLATLASLQSLARRQNSTLADEMDRLRAASLAAEKSLRLREADLANDRELALTRREKELAQLDWKIREVAAQLDGISRHQEVLAPFAGWVVYRAMSPGAAREHGILVVLSSENRFGFQVKLPVSQVAALKNAGDVTLDVGEGNLVRRFPARFLRSKRIDVEPSEALVELECQPPAEVIETMLEGTKVRARFVWRPPLISLWPFVGGLVLALVGLAGRILCMVLLDRNGVEPGTEPAVRRQPSAAPTAGQSSKSSELDCGSEADIGIMPAALNAGADTAIAKDTKHELELPPAVAPLRWSPIPAESGHTAEIVEMVAIQLREAIIHEQVTAETVGAAEWMLDRHHSRAVRIVRSIFRQDRSYLTHLDALPRLAEDGELSLHSRVLRILDVAGIGPQQLQTARVAFPPEPLRTQQRAS